MHREIQESAYDFQRCLESGERVVVGLNRYQQKQKNVPGILQIDPKRERSQIERLERFKANRDVEQVRSALDRLEDAAGNSKNLMQYVLDAVKKSNFRRNSRIVS